MKRPFDLNIPSIEHYPVTKVLTRSDLTTSQLVLPRRPVEEHILPYMNAQSRARLNADRRENIWVVDDELRTEHLLTLVDREHRFSIISWSHVLRTRNLEEGQTLRLGWMNDKLHFLVDGGEEDEGDDKGDGGDEGKRKCGSSEDVDQPPQKKSKQDEVKGHQCDAFCGCDAGGVMDFALSLKSPNADAIFAEEDGKKEELQMLKIFPNAFLAKRLIQKKP